MNKADLFLEKTFDRAAVDTPGLTAVFIHGIASDSSSFANALDYLAKDEHLKKVRLVAYDLLGAGKSLSDDKLLDYTYDEQITALHNSIKKLNIATPLVLVGHSMGTFIVTKYAETYKGTVSSLILVSPPVYTKKDLENPAFDIALKMFRDAVSVKNREVLETKAFNNSLDNIVKNKTNYDRLANLDIDATLIYGDMDKFISIMNFPDILKKNPDHLTAIKTIGHHGVSREKCTKVAQILKEMLNA
ncbi:alpha/beta fold hydrolase [Candidatus Saccharibacteria bacterium]|nr:alpha/beta fold hydrolase [Candidatus Saccharibacteria bacterium]